MWHAYVYIMSKSNFPISHFSRAMAPWNWVTRVSSWRLTPTKWDTISIKPAQAIGIFSRCALKQRLKAALKTLTNNQQFRLFLYEVTNPQNEIKPMHLNGYYTSDINNQIMFDDYSQRLRWLCLKQSTKPPSPFFLRASLKKFWLKGQHLTFNVLMNWDTVQLKMNTAV